MRTLDYYISSAELFSILSSLQQQLGRSNFLNVVRSFASIDGIERLGTQKSMYSRRSNQPAWVWAAQFDEDFAFQLDNTQVIFDEYLNIRSVADITLVSS